MAVKIRLQPRGQKNRVFFWIVVTDSRNSANSGNIIEKIGTYDPHRAPAMISLKEERVLYWLDKGAQPTNTTRTILSSQGLLLRRHLLIGVKKAALTQADADKKWQDWYNNQKKKSTISFSLPAAPKPAAPSPTKKETKTKVTKEGKGEIKKKAVKEGQPKKSVKKKAASPKK